MSMQFTQIYFFDSTIDQVFDFLNKVKSGSLKKIDSENSTNERVITIYKIDNLAVCENVIDFLSDEDMIQLSLETGKQIVYLDFYESYLAIIKLFSFGIKTVDIDASDEHATFETSDPRFKELKAKFDQIEKDNEDGKYDPETDDYMFSLEDNGLDFVHGPLKIFEILGQDFYNVSDPAYAQEKILISEL